MFFNNNGNRTERIGNVFYNSDGTSTQKIGSNFFSADGSLVQNTGSEIFTQNGPVIKNGDTYFDNEKTYQKNGNRLFSSDGRSWQGMDEMSDDDVSDIIAGDKENF
ncbi:MAG: hypothetical protein ACI4CS_05795 [Candidatus Weimeria sp.]